MHLGARQAECASMALKLFRSTGYSSILAPGESRLATHPGWVIAATSLWAGFACNVALWRGLWSSGEGDTLTHSMLLGIFVAAISAATISVFGWHKTIKPMATIVLLVAAAMGSAMWSEGQDFHASGFAASPFPSMTSLMHWQASALMLAIALLPAFWMWSIRVRRLGGPAQLRVNLIGACIGVAIAFGAALVLT
jgi:glucan phosphoethanolaminetransferase (alkaline phosphatase superfamily)